MRIIIFAPCTEYMKLLKPMKLLQAEISHRKNNYSLPGMMGDGSFPSPQKPHAGSYRRFLSKYVPNSSVLLAALQSPAVALLLSPWSQQPLGPQLLPPLLCPPPSGPEGSQKALSPAVKNFLFLSAWSTGAEKLRQARAGCSPGAAGWGSLCTPPVPIPSSLSTRATRLPWPLHQLLPAPPTHSPPCSWECAKSIYDRY